MKPRLLSASCIAVALFYFLALPRVTESQQIPAGEFTVSAGHSSAYNGASVKVFISVANTTPIGASNLLVTYDRSGITLAEVKPVGDLLNWEYKTYRTGLVDSCAGGACHTGYVRLIGIADINDGRDPGDVYLLNGQIWRLTFRLTDDRSTIGRCFPLILSPIDCEDNTMSSVGGDTIYFAYNIDDILPGADCLAGRGVTNIPHLRFVDGGVGIVPPLPDKGDCNGDSQIDLVDITYWIDYVFRNGPAPHTNPACNAACIADFNCDNRLNIADIAEIIRYVFRQPAPGPCDPCW